tara:strand:+ start:1916 stop:2161 length:246 start_codon:yes stop_codon:yes gene_type:complete
VAESIKESVLVKEVEKLNPKENGYKLGLDLNTDFAETYFRYDHETDEYDLFAKAYGKAIWNDISVFNDNEYIAGVSLGVSW